MTLAHHSSPSDLIRSLCPFLSSSQVSVGLPDVRGREEILKVHSGNKKLDKDVSLGVIAMRTPGFSGADLANLMNEAAILAARKERKRPDHSEGDRRFDRPHRGGIGRSQDDRREEQNAGGLS